MQRWLILCWLPIGCVNRPDVCKGTRRDCSRSPKGSKCISEEEPRSYANSVKESIEELLLHSVKWVRGRELSRSLNRQSMSVLQGGLSDTPLTLCLFTKNRNLAWGALNLHPWEMKGSAHPWNFTGSFESQCAKAGFDLLHPSKKDFQAVTASKWGMNLFWMLLPLQVFSVILSTFAQVLRLDLVGGGGGYWCRRRPAALSSFWTP